MSAPAVVAGRLPRAGMAEAAAAVLRRNDTGRIVRPAVPLYPHQWSWDAAFIAVGLATFDLRRACAELDELFRGQWRTGMVPHIVFDPTDPGYFPGPDRWACAELTADAPSELRTSGICQPPVHALAVERILDRAVHRGGDDARHVGAWAVNIYPKLLAWHRYLVDRRDPAGTGLLRICHGWESGMDNSPRWDECYSRVVVGADLPAYERLDTVVVPRQSQRPRAQEYDRYVWLIEELKRVGYDEERYFAGGSFQATDVFMSAIFAAANDSLARLAGALERPQEVNELRRYADTYRRGVMSSVDPHTFLAADRNLLTGELGSVPTCAGFAPLVCGGLDSSEQHRLVALLRSPRWMSHPQLTAPVLASTSPQARGFRRHAYWRGPTWPAMNWLFEQALVARGEHETAAQLREATLTILGDGSFAEYYDPFNGDPLGTAEHSWTAAVALDWLGDEKAAQPAVQ